MFNPEMMVLAREYRNITQEGLARKIFVTQATISKIEGNVPSDKSSDLVERIASALEFPVEFFYQHGDRLGFGSSSFYYRKRESITAADRKRITGIVNILRLAIKRMLNSVDLEPSRKLQKFSIDDFGGSAQEVAKALRSAWILPDGPIKNVTALIESAGVIVIPCDFGTKFMDATSLNLNDMPPLIFINNSIPSDRWRFTLAHELGHLVMHDAPSESMENEADQFAAELLMPESEMREQFRRYGKIRLQDFANMKPYWKVSMAALIVRASDLGCLTPTQAKNIWVQMSKAGYRLREPVPLHPEKAENFEGLFNYYLKDLSYSAEEIAKLTFMFPGEFSALGVGALAQKPRRQLRVVHPQSDAASGS